MKDLAACRIIGEGIINYFNKSVGIVVGISEVRGECSFIKSLKIGYSVGVDYGLFNVDLVILGCVKVVKLNIYSRIVESVKMDLGV